MNDHECKYRTSDDDSTVLTICDHCSLEIPLDEANTGDDGESLCNDCYAELYGSGD